MHEKLKQQIEALREENTSLKRQLLIYQSPFQEKYKNMKFEELCEAVSDLSSVPFLELIFIINVVVPEMLYLKQIMEQLQFNMDSDEGVSSDVS